MNALRQKRRKTHLEAAEKAAADRLSRLATIVQAPEDAPFDLG